MPVIEVDNLVKTYDGTNVVDGVSFSVEPGEIFGIVGPNGAGKTTTVESVEGLRRPDGGMIRVLGMDPTRDRSEITQRLGVQLQETSLQDKIRVGEALDLYASFYDNPADWRDLVNRLGLASKIDTLYGDLSGGQKQRVAVALALIGSPEIAILDARILRSKPTPPGICSRTPCATRSATPYELRLRASRYSPRPLRRSFSGKFAGRRGTR